MELSKKRWTVLAACCFINLCIGSIYAWSVFSAPMATYLNNLKGLNLTAGDLAIVFTIANSVGPITMISGGKINDKFGSKKVIFVGGVMFGGGLFLSGFATSVGMLIVTYGLISGLGLGMVYGCTISSCIKFFPDKRGLIGGITTATYGMSSVVIPPIANAIIQGSGVISAFKIIGIGFLIIVCASSFFVIKCPANYIPDGWTPPAQKGTADGNKDWKEMLQTPIFYIMLMILLCGAFCGLMCTSQTSSIAQNMIGMSATAATTAVSILALFNVSGRIIAGYISDKIGRISTLALACIVSIIGLSCLYLSGEGTVTTFYIGISLVGIGFGSFMGVFPGFTADQFGTKNNSVNYGIMFIGFALAGYFGPSIMRSIYSSTGAYQNAFLAACGLALTGIILTFIYRAISKKSISKTV